MVLLLYFNTLYEFLDHISDDDMSVGDPYSGPIGLFATWGNAEHTIPFVRRSQRLMGHKLSRLGDCDNTFKL
jgi:hypothetical protein